MPLDTTREQLDYTLYQARNTTLAGVVCDQPVLVSASETIDADTITDLWVVDSTDADVTMTLPDLASVPVGRSFSFYKLVAANSMIIDGNGSEQIEGAANETRSAQYAVVSITKVPISATAYGWQLEKADLTAGSLADNSVDSAQYVDGSIDPEHLAAGAVVGAALGGGTRANTVDTAVVLDAADAGTVVTVSSTAGAGTRTITVGTLPVGALVMIVMTAFDTNAYTAAVQGGTVTFNAVGEAGLFFFDGTALRFIAPGDVPATFA